LKAAKNVERSLGNEGIGEFHEQVALVIDGVFGGVGQRVLNVFKREMKIAARVDSRNGPGGTLQFGYFAIDPLRVERESCVSVRCGYDIGGTGFSRDFHHGDGILERLRAIIESGQNMAMDIDHV